MSNKDDKKKSKKEIDHENLNKTLEKLEDRLKNFFLSQIKASEQSLKSHLENRVQLYFDEIGERIAELIDHKYAQVHDRTYTTKSLDCSLSKEDVLQAVEFAISTENIEKSVKKYMKEFSLIQ